MQRSNPPGTGTGGSSGSGGNPPARKSHPRPVEQVVPRATGQEVVPGAAVDGVIPKSRHDLVVARAGPHGVRTIRRLHVAEEGGGVGEDQVVAA